MNGSFSSFFELGFDHILNISALDHILYVVVLTAIFSLKEWKKVLWLITAFTIGHSISLFCSALDVFSVPKDIIEFIIPFTILITAIINLFHKEEKQSESPFNLTYILALVFGFIHGMAFAGDIKAMLGTDSLLIAVFGFNIGIEIGQAILVIFILALAYVAQKLMGLSPKIWNYTLSIITAIYSIKMIIETL